MPRSFQRKQPLPILKFIMYLGLEVEGSVSEESRLLASPSGRLQLAEPLRAPPLPPWRFPISGCRCGARQLPACVSRWPHDWGAHLLGPGAWMCSAVEAIAVRCQLPARGR